MIMRKMLGSVVAYLDRLERVSDYDPMEAQARRLAALERRLDELTPRRQNGVAGREPLFDGAKRAPLSTTR